MNGDLLGCSVSLLNGHLASALSVFGSGASVNLETEYEFQNDDNYTFQDGTDYEFN